MKFIKEHKTIKENTLWLSTFSDADHWLSNFKPFHLLWKWYMWHTEGRGTGEHTLAQRWASTLSLLAGRNRNPHRGCKGLQSRKNPEELDSGGWTVSPHWIDPSTSQLALSLCTLGVLLQKIWGRISSEQDYFKHFAVIKTWILINIYEGWQFNKWFTRTAEEHTGSGLP